MLDELENLPRLELTSSLNNLTNLDGWDIDTGLFGQVNCEYYTIDGFKNSEGIHSLTSKSKSCSILHFNVRSLSANYDAFSSFLPDLNHKFNVIGLSGTKFTMNKEPTANINITGYNFISQPSHSNAGGVGFYIRKDYKFHVRDDFCTTTTDFECLSIELHNATQSNVVCSVFYRHPNSKIENFIEYYTKIMEKISNEKKYCIIMGDFDINLLNYESHPLTHEFLSNLGPYCFQPYITQPTRITDHSATLIDNIYFNSIEHETLSGNLICDITDHFPNFLILNKLACTSSNPTIYRRDYSDFNEAILFEEVRLINWGDVLPETEDVNLIFESFHDKLSNIINMHAPLHKLSKKKLG